MLTVTKIRFNPVLEAITHATESGKATYFALALEAARARASLGEISFAVEKYVAVIKRLFAPFPAYTQRI